MTTDNRCMRGGRVVTGWWWILIRYLVVDIYSVISTIAEVKKIAEVKIHVYMNPIECCKLLYYLKKNTAFIILVLIKKSIVSFS